MSSCLRVRSHRPIHVERAFTIRPLSPDSERIDVLTGVQKRGLQWPRRRLERRELAWLIGGLIICALLYAFITLAEEVMDGTLVRSTRESSARSGKPTIHPCQLDLGGWKRRSLM